MKKIGLYVALLVSMGIAGCSDDSGSIVPTQDSGHNDGSGVPVQQDGGQDTLDDAALTSECPNRSEVSQNSPCNVQEEKICLDNGFTCYGALGEPIRKCQCKNGKFACNSILPFDGDSCSDMPEETSCSIEGNSTCSGGPPAGGGCKCKQEKWLCEYFCIEDCPPTSNYDETSIQNREGTSCWFYPEDKECVYGNTTCSCVSNAYGGEKTFQCN